MDAFTPRITARTMCIEGILVPETYAASETYAAIVYLISRLPFHVDAACGGSPAVTP